MVLQTGSSLLLLQLCDQLLLVVQLVAQAAELLLMSIAVGVDLQLHGLLGRTQYRFSTLTTAPTCTNNTNTRGTMLEIQHYAKPSNNSNLRSLKKKDCIPNDYLFSLTEIRVV